MSQKKRQRNQAKAAARKAKQKQVRWLIWGSLALALIIGVVAISANQNKPQSGPTDIFRLSEQPSIGSPDAPVQIVEFGDFKCPYCAMFALEVYPEIKQAYVDTNKVQFFFINLAFLGPDSTTAAMMGEAIYEQDPAAFWRYYEALFREQESENRIWATRDFLLGLAKRVAPELDHEALSKAVDSATYRRRVEADSEIARRLGVNSVPAVFVNGEQVQDWTVSGLRRAIERELAAVGSGL